MKPRHKIPLAVGVLLVLSAGVFLSSQTGLRLQFLIANRFGFEKHCLVVSSRLLARARSDSDVDNIVELAVEQTFRQSFRVLDERLAARPDDFAAFVERADLYFMLHRYEVALADYTRAQAARKQNPVWVCGCIYSERKVQGQMERCKKLIEMESQQTPAGDSVTRAEGAASGTPEE
jgi:hypothetical protein